MTVSELIEELKKYPSDMPVVCRSPGWFGKTEREDITAEEMHPDLWEHRTYYDEGDAHWVEPLDLNGIATWVNEGEWEQWKRRPLDEMLAEAKEQEAKFQAEGRAMKAVLVMY